MTKIKLIDKIIVTFIILVVTTHLINYSKLGWYGGLLEKTKQIITLPWSLI